MCEHPLPISLIFVAGELASDQTHEERKRHDAELQVPSVSRYYVPVCIQRGATFHVTLNTGSFDFGRNVGAIRVIRNSSEILFCAFGIYPTCATTRAAQVRTTTRSQ